MSAVCLAVCCTTWFARMRRVSAADSSGRELLFSFLVCYSPLASVGVFMGVAALARLAGVGLSTTTSRDSAPSKRDRFAQSGDFWFTPCFSEVGRLPPRDRKRPQQYIRRRPECLKLKFARGIMPTPFVADAADEAVRSNSILKRRERYPSSRSTSTSSVGYRSYLWSYSTYRSGPSRGP